MESSIPSPTTQPMCPAVNEGGRLLSLADMPAGGSGVVESVEAGRGLVARLEALGVRPGKRVVKLTGLLMHGPVMLEVDRAQVAVGFGVAQKVLVRVDEPHAGK